VAGDLPGHPSHDPDWHGDLVARKWAYTDRRRRGRPSTGISIKTLIVRVAREHPAYVKPEIMWN